MNNQNELIQTTYMKRLQKDSLIFEIQQIDPPDAIFKTSDVEATNKMLEIVALINFGSDFEVRNGNETVKIPRSMTMQDRFRIIYENEDAGFITQTEECQHNGVVKVSCLHAKPNLRKGKLPEIRIILFNGETCKESWVNDLIWQSLDGIVPENFLCIFDICCEDINRQTTIATEALVKCCETLISEFMEHLRTHVRDDSVLELVAKEQMDKSLPCQMFLRPLVENDVNENGDVIDLDDVFNDSDFEKSDISSDCPCDRFSGVDNQNRSSNPIEELLCKFWMCDEWLTKHQEELTTESHYTPSDSNQLTMRPTVIQRINSNPTFVSGKKDGKFEQKSEKQQQFVENQNQKNKKDKARRKQNVNNNISVFRSDFVTSDCGAKERTSTGTMTISTKNNKYANTSPHHHFQYDRNHLFSLGMQMQVANQRSRTPPTYRNNSNVNPATTDYNPRANGTYETPSYQRYLPMSGYTHWNNGNDHENYRRFSSAQQPNSDNNNWHHSQYNWNNYPNTYYSSNSPNNRPQRPWRSNTYLNQGYRNKTFENRAVVQIETNPETNNKTRNASPSPQLPLVRKSSSKSSLTDKSSQSSVNSSPDIHSSEVEFDSDASSSKVTKNKSSKKGKGNNKRQGKTIHPVESRSAPEISTLNDFRPSTDQSRIPPSGFYQNNEPTGNNEPTNTEPIEIVTFDTVPNRGPTAKELASSLIKKF